MKDKKPILYKYDIKVEAMVPAILTYKVEAENEEEALKQLDKKHPVSFHPTFFKKRSIKATVYKAGSSIIQLTKYFKRS